MTEQEIHSLFLPLFSELEESERVFRKGQLFSHYTTFTNLKAIIEHDEVWFSNPLFMNDMEEVRFGMIEGAKQFVTSSELREAVGTDERYSIIKSSFDTWFNKFAGEHVFDTYVFCLSLHDAADNDGRLSMWRGYGANGNGACIVIDSSKIPLTEESPLIFGEVGYKSSEERIGWINGLISRFCAIIKSSNIPDNWLGSAAFYFFERIKLFALFTKHHGFKEEHEWRIVYLPDRDKTAKLAAMLDYWIGPRGIEPKLKFKIGYISGVTAPDVLLSKMIDRIILGPTISSPFAKLTTLRMLDKIQKPELKPKIISSGIPFRVMQ